MIDVDIQRVFDGDKVPSDQALTTWATAALSRFNKPFEMTIRIVDSSESQTLNHQYRDKDKPTNVLSFPFDVPDGIELNLLGDIIVCVPVVEREAIEQGKTLDAHWAHMVIHGCLHLLGFDHISDEEAAEMENLEIDILAELGFNNPYISS